MGVSAAALTSSSSWAHSASSSWLLPFSARSITSSTCTQDELRKSSGRATPTSALAGTQRGEITDKHIPKPVTVPEAASWSLVIAAAFAFLAVISYNVISTLFLEPVEQAAFGAALAKVRLDPRIALRLGDSIKGFGELGGNRSARQRIPSKTYSDNNGTEHVQLQFHISGQGTTATVWADMYKAEGGKEWLYAYLFVDLPPTEYSRAQRLVLVEPPQP